MMRLVKRLVLVPVLEITLLIRMVLLPAQATVAASSRSGNSSVDSATVAVTAALPPRDELWILASSLLLPWSPATQMIEPGGERKPGRHGRHGVAGVESSSNCPAGHSPELIPIPRC